MNISADIYFVYFLEVQCVNLSLFLILRIYNTFVTLGKRTFAQSAFLIVIMLYIITYSYSTGNLNLIYDFDHNEQYEVGVITEINTSTSSVVFVDFFNRDYSMFEYYVLTVNNDEFYMIGDHNFVIGDVVDMKYLENSKCITYIDIIE